MLPKINIPDGPVKHLFEIVLYALKGDQEQIATAAAMLNSSITNGGEITYDDMTEFLKFFIIAIRYAHEKAEFEKAFNINKNDTTT